MTLEQLYKFLLIDLGFSDNSMEAYLQDYKYFNLIDKGLCKTPEWRKILETIASISNHRTLSRRLSALKCYYDFFDLVWPKEFPKFPKFENIPKVPDEQTVHMVFEKVLSRKNVLPVIKKRDLCIFYLLYGCGLRISEISQLNVDDVLIPSKLLKVTGKGSKERLIPLSGFISEVLFTYLQVRNELKPTIKKFILNKNGKMITRQGLWKIVGLYCGEFQLHPHSFRHAFASHCLNNGMDVRHLQLLLGHSSPNTTQIYTKVNNDNIVNLLSKLNPFF